MLNMINDEHVYFCPGDIVTLRHDLENKPKMLVTEKISRNIVAKDGTTSSTFIGFKCRWFDKEQRLCEAIFSTKDLIKL